MDNQRPEAIRGKSLHAMTTEQLEELLRLEQDADRKPDVDLIEEILAVLDSRTEVPPVDVDSAWEDFKENHISGEPLYTAPDNAPTKPSNAHKKPLFRLAIAAAILAAVFLSISVSSVATGSNLWNVIVKWSSETFGLMLGNTSQTDDKWNSELYELAFALSRATDRIALVPCYLPDGYKQEKLHIEDNAIIGMFSNVDGDWIIIQYRKMLDNTGSTFQRDASVSEIYSYGGIEHYISTNMGNYLVVWVNNGWECNIMGVSSKQELLRMIDSIYSEE